jgi:hypothetical protein
VTWVKVDDLITEHEKCVGLSANAWCLWLHGLTYCSRNLTDGKIPKPMLGRLSGLSKPAAAARELVDAGLWDDIENAFWVHDYLDHQESREKVDAKRAAAAERQREWRDKKKSQEKSQRDSDVSDGVGYTTPETETPTDVSNPPTPLPIVPSVDNRSASHGHYPYDDRPAVSQAFAQLQSTIANFPGADA